MKNILFIAIALLLFSCEEKQEFCESKICTEIFVSVGVKYVDAQGKPLAVKNFEAFNLRTNKALNNSQLDGLNGNGYYTVASDLDLNNLSYDGDRIRVTATHPETGNTKQIEMVISGGKCACHIAKISGPEEVVL